MINTHNYYYFDPDNPSCNHGYPTPHSIYSVDQATINIVIELDVTRDKKVATDLRVFPRQVLVLTNFCFHSTISISEWNTTKDLINISGNKEKYCRC